MYTSAIYETRQLKGYEVVYWSLNAGTWISFHYYFNIIAGGEHAISRPVLVVSCGAVCIPTVGYAIRGSVAHGREALHLGG